MAISSRNSTSDDQASSSSSDDGQNKFAPSPELIEAAKKLKQSFLFYDEKKDIFYTTTLMDENTFNLIDRLEAIDRRIGNTKMSAKDRKMLNGQHRNLEQKLKPTDNPESIQHEIAELENKVNKKQHRSRFSFFKFCFPCVSREKEVVKPANKLAVK